MTQAIRKYLDKCDVCQKMQTRRYKSYGKLIPLSQLKRVWKDISMNFVTGLSPFFHRGIAYDAVLVVINRYLKMVQYIFCIKDTDTDELAEIMKNRIFQHFGMFKLCVFDRESLFISAWWVIFCYYWGMRRKFFIAFYPQTDGATKRQN
jgi:putative transposase